MKTDIVILEPDCNELSYALNLIEGLADSQGLARKDALHLRLLAEEVLSMVRLMVTDFNAKFWAEGEGKHFKLILEADVNSSVSETSSLLSLSSTGKNEADLGLGQKIARIFRKTRCITFDREPEFFVVCLQDIQKHLFHELFVIYHLLISIRHKHVDQLLFL